MAGRGVKRIVPVLVVVAMLAAVVFRRELSEILSLQALKANHRLLRGWCDAHPVVAPLTFIILYVVQTALSLPGALIFSLAAGALFGSIAGTLYAVTGATLGAALAFLVTRHLLHDPVQRRFGHRIEGVNRELERRGINYLLFLRLIPVFPFFLINLAAGLTRIPFGTFVAGTFVGIVPGAFVYVNAGASLATIESTSGILTPRVVGSFVLLGIFAIAPAIYARLSRRGETGEAPHGTG